MEENKDIQALSEEDMKTVDGGYGDISWDGLWNPQRPDGTATESNPFEISYIQCNQCHFIFSTYRCEYDAHGNAICPNCHESVLN